MIHAGHPVGIHGGFFHYCVLAPVALDLAHQMQQVVVAVAVIHQHDEVGQVFACFGAEAVGHFQTESVVFHVGAHFGVRFGDAAEFPFSSRYRAPPS